MNTHTANSLTVEKNSQGAVIHHIKIKGIDKRNQTELFRLLDAVFESIEDCGTQRLLFDCRKVGYQLLPITYLIHRHDKQQQLGQYRIAFVMGAEPIVAEVSNLIVAKFSQYPHTQLRLFHSEENADALAWLRNNA